MNEKKYCCDCGGELEEDEIEICDECSGEFIFCDFEELQREIKKELQ